MPHGLITELLPEVSTSLPANLSARRIPSAICDWLNSEKTSPFFGLIRRASTSEEQKAKTVVTDTSVVKMIEESLTSPAGCLFPYRNIATGETDFDGICKVLVETMGDCGAFSYIREPVPPVSPEDVFNFYDECRFDYGVSVDDISSAKDYGDAYREILEEQPWKKCPCGICKRIGIHVMLFRGAERNRRRGFHNVHVLYRRLRREIAKAA